MTEQMSISSRTGSPRDIMKWYVVGRVKGRDRNQRKVRGASESIQVHTTVPVVRLAPKH
jgi:hypothetical protein